MKEFGEYRNIVATATCMGLLATLKNRVSPKSAVASRVDRAREALSRVMECYPEAVRREFRNVARDYISELGVLFDDTVEFAYFSKRGYEKELIYVNGFCEGHKWVKPTKTLEEKYKEVLNEIFPKPQKKKRAPFFEKRIK